MAMAMLFLYKSFRLLLFPPHPEATKEMASVLCHGKSVYIPWVTYRTHAYFNSLAIRSFLRGSDSDGNCTEQVPQPAANYTCSKPFL